jgi:hypothetical protein
MAKIDLDCSCKHYPSQKQLIATTKKKEPEVFTFLPVSFKNDYFVWSFKPNSHNGWRISKEKKRQKKQSETT